MVLSIKGKNERPFHTKGNLRLNVFSWNDGFYNVELQEYDGISMWNRQGKTKCITKAEFEEMEKNNRYEIYQGE
ncbi:MAG: hypothetical protein GY861_12875 [bacterium]|nr:hypothetical protein [bacterium]